tara:strand:+ start:446 stop:625 length:180 start_codon:yes stop_codon:yes gene_type:complete
MHPNGFVSLVQFFFQQRKSSLPALNEQFDLGIEKGNHAKNEPSNIDKYVVQKTQEYLFR